MVAENSTFIPIKQTKKARKGIPAEYIFRHTKKAIKGELKSRLSHIYVPPAYTNLQVAKSAKHKIQLIGEDIAGRKQYVYHAKHIAGMEKRKYGKLEELGKNIVQIEKDNLSAIKAILRQKSTGMLNKSDLIQFMIYMLRTYHFRIGCDKYAELYGSHGLSTLEPRHFKSENGGIKISFIGKKGVKNNTHESNGIGKKLIKRLLVHYHALGTHKLAGKSYLYQYTVHTVSPDTTTTAAPVTTMIITSDDIQDYFKATYSGIYVTPKMFRTWYANYHMLEYLRDLPSDKIPTPREAFSKMLKQDVGDYVSKHLNNTPSICRKNYINNKLLQNILDRPQYYLEECKKRKTPSSLHKYLATLI